jgi:hypothetical protein
LGVNVSLSERLGLVLFAIGAVIVPFGYWVNVRWVFVAAVFALPGLLLALSGRVRRHRSEGSDADHVDVPPGPHELKGFRGAAVLGHADVDGADAHD